MNSPYTAPKTQLVEPVAKRFSFRSALIAYLTAVTIFETLTIWLGWVVSGQLPTARGYWILLPYVLISAAVVALIAGKLVRISMLGAIGVGIIGGLSLLTITSVAAYAWGVFYRAV